MPFKGSAKCNLGIDRRHTSSRTDVVRQLTADIVFERLLGEAREEFARKTGKPILGGEATQFALDILGIVPNSDAVPPPICFDRLSVAAWRASSPKSVRSLWPVTFRSTACEKPAMKRKQIARRRD